jgi:hypothetical protein
MIIVLDHVDGDIQLFRHREVEFVPLINLPSNFRSLSKSRCHLWYWPIFCFHLSGTMNKTYFYHDLIMTYYYLFTWNLKTLHECTSSYCGFVSFTLLRLNLQTIRLLIRNCIFCNISWNRPIIFQTMTKKQRDLEKVNKTHEENALKRDQAIQGLAKVIMERDIEVRMCSLSFSL